MMGKSKAVASFLLLPASRSDVGMVKRQIALFVYSIAKLLASAELLPSKDPALKKENLGREGVFGLLVRATERFIEESGQRIGAEWQASAAAGLLAQIGAVGMLLARAPLMARQVSVLGALWGMVGGCGIGALIVLAFLMVGTAHAATDLAASTDVAHDLLPQVFGFMGSSGSTLANAAGTLLGSFSIVVYCFVVMTIVWHLLLFGVALAEKGTARDNSTSAVWFVLRAAVAAGALYPATGGWCASDRLIVWGASLVSDQASSAWGGFTGKFTQLGNYVSAPPTPSMNAVVRATFVMEVCRAAIQVRQSAGGVEYSEALTSASNGSVMTKDLVFGNYRVPAFCGRVDMPQISAGTTGVDPSAMTQVHKTAFEKMDATLQPIAQQYAAAVYACLQGDAGCVGKPAATAALAAVTSYSSDISTGIKQAWLDSRKTAADAVGKLAGTGGWAAAGRWAFALSAINGTLSQAGQTTPNVTAPKYLDDEMAGILGSVDDWWSAAAAGSSDPTISAGQMGAWGKADGMISQLFLWVSSGTLQMVSVDASDPIASLTGVGHQIENIGGGVLGAAGMVAGGGKLLSVFPNIVGKANPVSAAGTWLLNKVYDASGIADMLKSIMSAIIAFCLLLIFTGIGIGYGVPALPFIRMFMIVVRWLAMLIEAVVLFRLALLGMVSADGAGLFGHTGRQALIMVVAVMVIPFLAVIGFIFAIIVASPLIYLLNSMFIPFMQDASKGGGTGMFGFIAFAVMYLGVAWATINVAFKIPDQLVGAVGKWAGANAVGERDDAHLAMNAAMTVKNTVQTAMDRFSNRMKRA